MIGLVNEGYKAFFNTLHNISMLYAITQKNLRKVTTIF